MKLDPDLRLDQLVSCDGCYCIFSPDNIFEGVEAKKHICPRCQEREENQQEIAAKLQKQLDKKFKELYDNLLIEVTRIIDVRESKARMNGERK